MNCNQSPRKGQPIFQFRLDRVNLHLKNGVKEFHIIAPSRQLPPPHNHAISLYLPQLYFCCPISDYRYLCGTIKPRTRGPSHPTGFPQTDNNRPQAQHDDNRWVNNI